MTMKQVLCTFEVTEIICQCSVDEDEHSNSKCSGRCEITEVPSSLYMVNRLQWGFLGLHQDFIDCTVFGLCHCIHHSLGYITWFQYLHLIHHFIFFLCLQQSNNHCEQADPITDLPCWLWVSDKHQLLKPSTQTTFTVEDTSHI